MICDLNTPTCDKCTKIGRRCDYGKVRLRWTDCVASRGRLAGKKIPLYQPPIIQKTTEHHLLYFENQLLPRFNLTGAIPTVDLKALSLDPVLLQSVVAVANAHAAYRSADPNSLTLSKIQDRNNALRLFRTQLMELHTDEGNNSLFMANVLLCILDGIVEPITESSATHHHIVGGKAILKQWEGAKDIFLMKAQLPVLMLSIFVTMDMTHACLIGDDPYFDDHSWKEFGGCEAWWGTVNEDDDFLKIMAILSRLSTLGNQARNLRSPVPIGELLALQQALDQQGTPLKRESPGGSPMMKQIKLEDEIDNKPSAGWIAFCDCYRYSASVYLYRALSGLEVDHDLVQGAVANCMEVIRSPDLDEKLQHCVLFPVLIVGSHCLSEDHRNLIRGSIHSTSKFLNFESLRAMEGFLEKRWAKLDSYPQLMRASWWEYFEDIASVTCLF